VPDLPGFGLSGDPGASLDTTRLAAALGGWLHAAGTAPAVLLGNSYGCQVIVDLVARHPEVAAALVLASPTTDPHARTVSRQVRRWLRDAMHEDPLQAPILLRDVRDAGPVRVFATLRHAVRDRIEENFPTIAVPALVIRGGIEPIVPARWADEAARLLPPRTARGPTAQPVTTLSTSQRPPSQRRSRPSSTASCRCRTVGDGQASAVPPRRRIITRMLVMNRPDVGTRRAGSRRRRLAGPVLLRRTSRDTGWWRRLGASRRRRAGWLW
jgi:hypothetical protein